MDPTILIPLVIVKGPRSMNPCGHHLRHPHHATILDMTREGGKPTEGSFAKVFDVNSLSILPSSPRIPSPSLLLLASCPTIHHPRKPDLSTIPQAHSPSFDSLDLSSGFHPNQPCWFSPPNSPRFGWCDMTCLILNEVRIVDS